MLCRRIKPVDIAAVLGALHRMQFVHVNQGGNTAERYACDVVLADKFAQSVSDLISGLELGGRTARAILRRLPARQCIPAHVDAWMPDGLDWHRFQLPLITDPRVVMQWPDDGIAEHLEAGWLYEVRYDRKHEVIHGADCARIHLQIDQIDSTI